MFLTKIQKEAIINMRKYPNDIVMFNGYMTGGHGVKIKLNTISALERLGIIENAKLTDFGRILSF
jgi:hypothetical protein